MKRLLLLFMALLTLGVGGAWATDVVISDRTNTVATGSVTTTNEHKYGTYSNAAGGTTFTTNATSGMAGVTVTGDAAFVRAAYFDGANYKHAIAFNPSDANAHTITISAPEGYKVTGYSITAISTSSGRKFTVTPAGDTPSTGNVTAPGTTTITKTGLDAQTATINIQAATANTGNFLCFPLFSVTVLSATTPIINVTYELYESDGTTKVSSVDSVTKEQEANSEPEIPSSLKAATYYDYSTEGTIGDSDCTIKVIRTLKSGVVLTTANLSNSKCYTISTIDRGSWVVPNNATAVTSTTKANLAFSASDLKQQFAFIYYDDTSDDSNDGYYLYSVSARKFISKSGNYTTLTDKPGGKVGLLASSGSNSYPVVVAFNDGANQAGISNGFDPAVITHYNSLTDDGNRAYIYEAGSFDATDALAVIQDYFHPTHTITYVVKDGSDNTIFSSGPIGAPLGSSYTTFPSDYYRNYFYTYSDMTPVTITDESDDNTDIVIVATHKTGILQYTANTTSPIYYNLNIRSKYLAYNDEATGDVELLDSSTPFNPNAAWAFIGDPYTGFKIINQTNGTDKYLTYTSVVTGSNHGNNNIQFVAAGDFTNQYWFVESNTGGICLRMKENTNIYFHHDYGNNFLRTCSYSEYGSVHNDAGSTIVFASDEDVLVNLYNDLKDVFFGEGFGYYTWEGSGTAELARANINGAGTALQYHATSSYKDLYDALLDIKENISLNPPTAGFYRIKGKTSNKYLAAGMASNNKFNMTTAEDATTIFYYDGTKLTNLSSGMCNGVTSSSWEWVIGDNASTVTFHYGHIIGGYGIKTAKGDAAAYFYDNGDNSASADRGKDVNMSSGDDRYRNWEVTEITSLPVTIKGAVDWATFYSPVALTIPDVSGLKVYYVSAVTANEATLTQITGTIPAETAVLINYSVDSDFTANFEITETDNTIDDNLLLGTDAAISVSAGDMYTLQLGAEGSNHPGEPGLYPKTAGTLAGFKAYLPVENANEVKGLVFTFNDATGITRTEQSQGSSAYYNLAGQRVQQPSKGIYIVNGKKTFIK